MSIGEASPSWVTQSCVGGREEPSLGEDGTGREEEKQAKLGWVVLPLVPEHRLSASALALVLLLHLHHPLHLPYLYPTSPYIFYWTHRAFYLTQSIFLARIQPFRSPSLLMTVLG